MTMLILSESPSMGDSSPSMPAMAGGHGWSIFLHHARHGRWSWVAYFLQILIECPCARIPVFRIWLQVVQSRLLNQAHNHRRHPYGKSLRDVNPQLIKKSMSGF